MTETTRKKLNSIGLAVLRIGIGGLLAIQHGWPKLVGFSEKAADFPDPLGVGSAASLTMAVAGEFLCGLLVAVGLFTRAACVPALITMLVAAFVVHADDPFARKEFALVYAIPFLTLLLTGPGDYSLDRKFFRKN